MTMETALRAKLLAAAPVTNIVGTKVDWTKRPQGNTLPAVVLIMVTDPRPQTMDGFVGFRETRVQIDCYGASRAQVVTLREAVIAAIAVPGTTGGVIFGRAFINNVLDRGEDRETGFVHRDMIDAAIWHNA